MSVAGLKVSFATSDGIFTAVKGIDLDVKAGEVVAVVGESGSGKTVSALSILGLLPKQARIEMEHGELAGEDLTVRTEASMRRLRGSKVGMIFQDPLSSLNPVQRVGKQIVEAIELQTGLRGGAAKKRGIELLQQVGIPDAANRFASYPHEFSGGMRQRAMIAMALVSPPPLLIADEPTTALDVTVQAQILELLRELRDELDMGVMLITHDLGVVAGLADRVVVMNRGDVVERGSTAEILGNPQEEYTSRLLDAVPRLDRPGRNRPLSASGEPVLSVDGLEVVFGQKRRFGKSSLVSAVNGVDLDLPPGRTLGLVGESGCGKTTLGRAIIQLNRPTEGTVEIYGDEISGLSDAELRPLRRKFQIFFQDPQSSLNPRFTIERTLAEPLEIHKLVPDGAKRRERIIELLELVGLGPEHLTRRPHELSGGQRQRVGIARALAVEPKIVVLDEAVSALDVSVQAEILTLLERLQDELGIAYLFIAHDLAVVRQISDEVAVMYLGRIVEYGPAEKVYTDALHPYTAALLSAVPVIDTAAEEHRSRERIVLAGDPPSPLDIPPGCPFQNRCWLREKLGNPSACSERLPELAPSGDGGDQTHLSACHFADEHARHVPAGVLPGGEENENE